MELNDLAEEVVGIEVAGRKWGYLTSFDPTRQGHGVTLLELTRLKESVHS